MIARIFQLLGVLACFFSFVGCENTTGYIIVQRRADGSILSCFQVPPGDYTPHRNSENGAVWFAGKHSNMSLNGWVDLIAVRWPPSPPVFASLGMERAKCVDGPYTMVP